MAAGLLTIAPHLLPWQQAGVDFLLAQDDLPPEFSLCHAAQPVRAVPPARQHAGQAQPAPAHRTPQPAREDMPAARFPQTPLMGGMAQRMAERRNAPAQQEAVQRQSTGVQPRAQAGAAQPATPLTLPPEHWPRPWRERFKATKPGPVVWTYWALGEDLCGAPNAERRGLLRRLLGDLGHPAGTHTFWPAAMPPASAVGPVEAAALEAHAQVFWAGVDMLKARALVVMGSPAVKALELPPRLRPFQQTRHNGRLVVVLRDVDFLVAENHHYDAVREFLRQALAPFGRQM